MMFRILTAAVTTLLVVVPLALAGEPSDRCISCGWISPEGTRALFQLNDQMDESLKSGHAIDIGNPLKDKHLMDMMEDVVALIESPQCNESQVAKLVAMLARLEEGQVPMSKNRVKYVKKGLVGTLERQFIKILNSCLVAGIRTADLPKIQADLLEFVSFGEVLKNSLQFGAPGEAEPSIKRKLETSIIAKLSGYEPDLSPAGNTLNQAAKIMASDQLVSRVHDIWGHYFKADPNDGPQCQQSLNGNLVQKYAPLSSDLGAIFKPLHILMGYNPENFVLIPESEKQERGIFDVLRQARQVLKDNKKLSELMHLHKLLKQTFRRADDYCPSH